jgi:hypothetical protein
MIYICMYNIYLEILIIILYNLKTKIYISRFRDIILSYTIREHNGTIQFKI